MFREQNGSDYRRYYGKLSGDDVQLSVFYNKNKTVYEVIVFYYFQSKKELRNTRAPVVDTMCSIYKYDWIEKYDTGEQIVYHITVVRDKTKQQIDFADRVGIIVISEAKFSEDTNRHYFTVSYMDQLNFPPKQWTAN